MGRWRWVQWEVLHWMRWLELKTAGFLSQQRELSQTGLAPCVQGSARGQKVCNRREKHL